MFAIVNGKETTVKLPGLNQNPVTLVHGMFLGPWGGGHMTQSLRSGVTSRNWGGLEEILAQMVNSTTQSRSQEDHLQPR